MHNSLQSYYIKYISIFLVGLLSFSCNPKNEEQLTGIVTTTSILSDIVKNIVPKSINVESLMGPGVDPHLYKASQGDVRKLSEAQIILYNGLHLEGKMGEVLERLSRTKNVYAFAEQLEENDLRLSDSSSSVYDPHIWFNLKITYKAIEHLSSKLQALLPDESGVIKQLTTSYLSEVKETYDWCSAQIDSIPESARILITSHDAFGYFGIAHNFTVKGLQGISTMSESGLKDVTDMVNFIIDNKIKAIFVENSVPQKALRSVMEGCMRKGHEVRIGGELYSDALGQERTPEGTYLGMVKYNVQTISSALK